MSARRLAVLLLVCPVPRLSAQTIDTIVVENHNVFDAGTGPGFVARLANTLHVTTHAGVIRRTLLFDTGDRYDSARVTESERALRALSIFRQVRLDTVHLDGRLGVRVFTADGWSTKPQTNFSSAGGSVRWEKLDRKSTRLNSSHPQLSRMPSSA